MFKVLKQVFIFPFRRAVPTELLGKTDQWAITRNSLDAGSFIISAGVGQSITFEDALVARFDATVILLDPSPTGLNTIQARESMRNLTFLPIGLARQSGTHRFVPPERPEEGSFRKAQDGDGPLFRCTSVADLLKVHNRHKIDLLKIDVEGCEYEILESILDSRIEVDQICVEIHHNRVIPIDKTVLQAALLILRLVAQGGYRIIYNKNMDFTFANKRFLARFSAAGH